MAAAACTVIENVRTIESDNTGAVITKALTSLTGVLKNHGPNDVWLVVAVGNTTAALVANVVTTGVNNDLQCPLPVGGEFEWIKDYNSVAHKTDTAGKTAVLSWRPRGLK